MKVKDIMTKMVHSVKPEEKVGKAVYYICRYNIAGLPVVDEKGKVVGVISEKDILKEMYPGYEEFYSSPLSAMDFEEMEQNYREVNNLKAKDVMTSPAITVTPETPVLKAGSLMILKKIRRLPVVDDEGKLTGIISQGDIHRAVFRCYVPLEEIT
jgi:CBS domain-containing protein